MKTRLLLLLLLFGIVARAQTNCNAYKDQPHRLACQYYQEAINFNQGSKRSQELFIASLKACPTFAPTLHEMSVPYLKRGDFFTWKQLIDQAVASDPDAFLGDRGWCLFKFLRDYKMAFADLTLLYKRTNGNPGYSGDGDYDLRIIMGLCKRAMGENKAAIVLFNECISEHEKQQTTGLFDYLHRGITFFKMKNYTQALVDFQFEIKKYEKLADTYYYMGLTYAELGQKQQAIAAYRKAKELFNTGYHRNDPYCEEPDQVYLSDVDNKLIAMGSL